MTEYNKVLLDTSFSSYADWNGMSFTYEGETYTVDENAFVYSSNWGPWEVWEEAKTYSALQAVADGGTIIIRCYGTLFGGYYDDNEPPAKYPSWDMDGKTVTISNLASNPYTYWLNLKGGTVIIPTDTTIMLGLGSAIEDTENNSGALVIEEGATFTINGGQGDVPGEGGSDYLYNPLHNVTVKGKLSTDGASGFNLSGANTVIGSQTEVGKYDSDAKMYVQSGLVLRASAEAEDGTTLLLTDGAYVYSASLTRLQANSTITLEGSKLQMGPVQIAEGAAINLDVDSKLIVTGKTTNNGTITVDAAGFTGIFRKVVDLNGLTGAKAVVKNLEEGMNVIQGSSGDVIITSADVTHFIIDSRWSGMTEADPIQGKDGFYYNVNAYSELGAAYDNLAAGITEDIDIQYGTIDFEGGPMQGGGSGKEVGQVNLILEKDTALRTTGTTQNWGVDDDEDDDATLTVKAGAQILAGAATGHLHAQSKSKIILDGTQEDHAIIDLRYDSQALDKRANLSITSDSSLDATYGDITVDELKISDNGVVSLKNSVLDADNDLIVGPSADAQKNPKLSLDASTLTVREYGTSQINGTIEVTNGSSYTTNAKDANNTAATTLKNDGTITVSEDSKMAVNCNFTNNGTVTLDRNSTLSVTDTLTNNGAIKYELGTVCVGSFATGANGTLTVDLTGATSRYYTLVDVEDGGTGSYNVSKVTLENCRYYVAADVNNDLLAVNTADIMINTVWTEESHENLGDGYFWGVNAFGSLETAVAACHDGSRTYTYVSDANQILTLIIDVTDGSSSVSFGTAGDSKSYTVLGSKTIQSEITKGEKYVLAFQGEKAEYSFIADYTREITHETPTVIPDVGEWTSTPDGTVKYESESADNVGYCPDSDLSAQEYKFTVAEGASGEYAITIDPEIPQYEKTADRISYTITDEGGKKYASGSATSKVTRTMNLTEGNYTIVVDSYDHGGGKYETAFKVSIEAKVNADVSDEDDTFNGTAVTTLAAGDSTGSKFVGLGDKTDWIKLGIASTGKYTVTLDPAASGDTIAAGLRVYLVQVEGTKKTTLKSATYKDAPVAFSDVLLDAAKCNGTGNGYYIQVSAPNASTSSYNATYKVALTGCTANSGVNSADDTWNGTGVQTLANNGSVTDWVGTEDEVDYVKLTGMEAKKTYNLTLDVADGGTRIFATIYRKKTKGGVLSTVASFNGYAKKDAVTKTFACASGYDYYVRFKTAAGTDVSNGYTASLALKA